MLQKSLYNHKWQYNGRAPMDEIRDWCRQNIKGHSYLGWETIWFASEQDYVLFLLRWS
jgi:hypothetical protein